MNKKFYFALALTAGLFASCSSDDVVSQAPGLNFNDSDAAQIKISVSSPTTRGTGSVTGTQWSGQTFNIFMFEKGTFTTAQYSPTEGAAPVDIFNNDTLTTNKENMSASYIKSNVEQFNYFPSTGNFDFWAYRADDAGGAPVGVNDANADTVKIPVTIDGSQDLMIAVADTVAAATALAAAEPTKFATADEALGRIYSAYSARRGVNPKLQFRHLLSRLYFYVKAADRDVSEAATLKTTDANEIAGFSVTKVTVKSKSTGNILAAFKGGIPENAERIIWDEGQDWADTATLTKFELKSRVKVIDEKADVKFIGVNPSAESYNTPADYETFTSGEYLASGTPVTISDELVCYKAVGTDAETGLPLAENKTTVGAAKVAGISPVYFVLVKPGTHTDGVTSWDKVTYTEDASKPLIDLIPVTPEWTGYTPATSGTPTYQALTQKATGYVWGPQLAALPAGESSAGTLDARPTSSTVGTAGSYYTYNDYGVNVYFLCSAVKYNTDDATNTDTDPTALTPTRDDLGKILYYTTGDAYYQCNDVGGSPAVEGDAVETPVGESLLVAPADNNGYIARFEFTRTKKITGDHVEPMTGFAEIPIKLADPTASFGAGKAYKITAVLYSDGEIKFDENSGEVIDYEDGTSELVDGGVIGLE